MEREEYFFRAKQGSSRRRVSKSFVAEISVVFGGKYSKPIRLAQKIYMLQILQLVIYSSQPWSTYSFETKSRVSRPKLFR